MKQGLTSRTAHTQRGFQQASARVLQKRGTTLKETNEMAMPNNNTATEDRTDVVEDEEIVVPESTSFPTIPPGVYTAALVGFKTVDKPAWKLRGEEGEDKEQWRWVFRITEGEYAGTELHEFTNRTWHEKAKAHKHAAALLGVPTLTPGVALSTRSLAGKLCQLWVTEVESKKEPGQFRNYVDKCLPMPQARMRPQRPQSGSQTHTGQAVGRVNLPGYPSDGDEAPDFLVSE